MSELTNEEKMMAVAYWQEAGIVHPLTCGNQSMHEELIAHEHKGEVILLCPTCGYRQTFIPACVYTYWKTRQNNI